MGIVIPTSISMDAQPVNPWDDLLSRIALLVLFSVPAVAVTWYLIHCRIVAGESGIALIGYFRSHFFQWQSIDDYELRIPSAQQSKSGLPIAYLKIQGQWRKLSRSYLPYDALLERIALEAKWSKSHQWQRDDVRDDGEWPKIFVYEDVSGWKIIAKAALFSITLLALNIFKAATYGWKPFLANIALTWSGLSVGGRLGFVAMPLLLFGVCSVPLLAQFPAIKTRRRCLGQKIVATHEGLSYLKNGTEILMRWDEICSYHLESLPGNLQPNLAVIESRRDHIEFMTGIANTKTLMALVTDRATQASTKSWGYLNGASEEILGGASSLWSSGNTGIGIKTHHYRTRSNRVFLLFGFFMVVAFIFQVKSGYLGNGQPMTAGDYWCGVILFCPVALASVAGLFTFLHSFVQIETGGLRQSSPWSKRFLRWNEIKRFETNGGYFILTGPQGKMRIAGLIADPKGLSEEIEKQGGVQLVKNGKAF